VEDWSAHAEREERRYRDGEARVDSAGDPDARQRQLTRLGNAAYGAGLALLMERRLEEARPWLGAAAARYRESFADAPPGSWGRPIGAMKARVLADDWERARAEADWALEAGAAAAEGAIAGYAAALAHLIRGDWRQARVEADRLRLRDDFPHAVGDALAMIAAGTDAIGYVEALEEVLDSFESRDEYLEDVPVADTVIVLRALGELRGLTAELDSALLPR
jgi:hypothetical protein